MALTCWEKFNIAASSGARRILLTGAKGLAKSRSAIETLKNGHGMVHQCTLNEDIAVQELLGHYVPKGSVFEWHDGPVMAAYRNGNGLVVNEMGRASGAVQDMFLAVMDDESVSMISLANGENVTPGAKFQIIATSNSGPESLDDALRDRFDTIIPITTPHPLLIEHINKRAENLGTIIERSYQDPANAISPRRALTFLSFIEKGVELETALDLSFDKRKSDIAAAIKLTAAARK